MAHFAVFSILLVALAASGANAGLIPDLPTTIVPVPVPIPVIPNLPNIIPTPESKADAVNKVQRGCDIGKKGVNLRISAFIKVNNINPALSPVCKECIAKKSNEVRQSTLNEIDNTRDELTANISAASETWLSVWDELIEDLPKLILGVLSNCREQLNTARSDCIAQEAAPPA